MLLKDLKINSTPKTPEVNFSSSTGDLNILGVSVPENSMGFYNTITDWVGCYIESPAETTRLTFKLTYVNTSSLQFIYDMLSLLTSIQSEKSKVIIEWYYLNDDDDMKQMGEDFKEAVGIDFSFIKVEND